MKKIAKIAMIGMFIFYSLAEFVLATAYNYGDNTKIGQDIHRHHHLQ